MVRQLKAYKPQLKFNSPFLRSFVANHVDSNVHVYDASIFHTYFLTEDGQVARANNMRFVLPLARYTSESELDVDLTKLVRKATEHSGRTKSVYQSQLLNTLQWMDFNQSNSTLIVGSGVRCPEGVKFEVCNSMPENAVLVIGESSGTILQLHGDHCYGMFVEADNLAWFWVIDDSNLPGDFTLI